MFRPVFLYILGALGMSFVSNAQTILTCNQASVSPVIRGEGITERIGDIVFNCSGGTPGATITGNFSIFLNVNITNRVAKNGNVAGVIFSIDNGSGPEPVNVPGVLNASNTLVYNGVSFMLSPMGAATLRIADIRAAANQLGLARNAQVEAFIAFNSNLLAFNQSHFAVGTPITSLYDGFSTSIICATSGSPLPANVTSFASFRVSKAAFASTRLTEGFATAFAQRSATDSLNADTGTRFLITYAGFPAGAQLFVPSVIAGSDAVMPTAAGDLGVQPSGGKYAPSVAGSLLLSLVQNTDANGAGGSPAFTPLPPGSGTVSFDLMSRVPLNNGSGIAVYEVVDANPNVQESAQFPTYLGLAPFSGNAVITTETVSLAPVSTVALSTIHDPIPRFETLPPPADCSIIGDCNAPYYPKLFVNTTPLNFTAQSGGNFQVGYVQVNNKGGGHMPWAASIGYTNGSDWIQLFPSSGIDNSTIRVDALPANLAAGNYQALLTVDAGPQTGSATVPITFVVTPQPAPPPPPTVTSIVNGATFAAGPAVPGSISTLLGMQLGGTNVTAAFDGLPAQLLFDSSTQINLVVPAGLGNKASSQLVLIVDGNNSVAQTVPLAAFGPGIFKNGILNQDGKTNDSSHPARAASILQIFATGLSGNGAITARVNGTVIDPPVYGGPAPGLAGVQQVNVQLPTGLTGTAAQIEVCGGPPGQPGEAVCSPAVQVAIRQ